MSLQSTRACPEGIPSARQAGGGEVAALSRRAFVELGCAPQKRRSCLQFTTSQSNQASRQAEASALHLSVSFGLHHLPAPTLRSSSQ